LDPTPSNLKQLSKKFEQYEIPTLDNYGEKNKTENLKNLNFNYNTKIGSELDSSNKFLNSEASKVREPRLKYGNYKEGLYDVKSIPVILEE
jgi:hypothetical protein